MNVERLEAVSLRLPAALSETIRKRAKENRRSFNSEAILLLEQRMAAIEETKATHTEAA